MRQHVLDIIAMALANGGSIEDEMGAAEDVLDALELRGWRFVLMPDFARRSEVTSQEGVAW